LLSIFVYANNLADVAWQSNMRRLKYGDENVVTGRIGVHEMGRNIGFKINVPIDFKKQEGIIFLNGKLLIFELSILYFIF